jgi:hypothetical protein
MMGCRRLAPFKAAALLVHLAVIAASAADPSSVDALISVAVRQLVGMQEPDGAWPYEGVYRVGGEIPLGYRVGGTAIVCETLLYSAADDTAAATAIERGVALILRLLDDPLLAPSTEDTYDVRVWAHAYALQLFCRLRAADRCGSHNEAIAAWIPRLVSTLRREQLDDGGWNYANRRGHATFVTAPVVQALLLARAQGEDVPGRVFERARQALRGSRYSTGAFAYSGAARAAASQPASATQPVAAPATRRSRADKDAVPGAIARGPVCEATLLLLGDGSADAVRDSLDAFHTHWDWLEKRRKQPGTHLPPYGVAPYYFYYGHRYAAQAIELLPQAERMRERARLLDLILRTRDDDGTWNDRVFPRSRNFGTAMIVLALLGERQPLPPALGK